MTSLKSFLHVSTLYSNSDRLRGLTIEEKIHQHVYDYNQIISISKTCNSAEDEAQYLHTCFPNTYTMTKHFAEKIVNAEADILPTGIYRPPIIVNCYQDHPGYVENLNGPAAMAVAVDKGYLRFFPIDKSKDSNGIPADYCINAMIVMAWDVFVK